VSVLAVGMKMGAVTGPFCNISVVASCI
jgi:hypothetical protein